MSDYSPAPSAPTAAAAAPAPTPVLNTRAMQMLGSQLKTVFETYVKDRKPAEEQWMRNLRQFRGLYDPEIASQIPSDQSTAYPKVTRNKVIGTVARLMEMLFPRTDKNYSVAASPLPDLSTVDLQTVLDALQAQTPQGQDLTDDQIEKAIKSYADAKAVALEKRVDDQLTELDYVRLARRVVFSGVLYGAGVLRGPMTLSVKSRSWKKDENGRYVAYERDRYRPLYENRDVWGVYTDMSAKSLYATDGEFERHVMTRAQVQALAKRPDFLKDQIDAYLRGHAGTGSGNHKEQWWETELRSRRSDKANVSDITGRKFEVLEYLGCRTGQELRDCGVPVNDDQLGVSLECSLWMIDTTIIKAELNLYDGKHRGFHWFIYEEDDINLLGNGLPVVMRDSQMAICESARMILDNGSVVCGPMLEIDASRLVPGTDLDVYARKIWPTEGENGPSQGRAVQEIEVNSHIPELIQIIDLFMGFADAETALPPPALGDVSGQGKESLRTTGNLSMLLGAAALPIRDTVRNFDKFTVSTIDSLCDWNQEFDPSDEISGDFNTIARGSTSLIAKEVRAGALDQFAATLTPDERVYVSTKKMLLERMRVRDLPDDLLEDDNVVQQKLQEQAQNAAAQAQQQQALIAAQVKEAVAAAFKDLMLGLKAQAGASADTFNSIVGGIVDVRAQQHAEATSEAAGSGAAPANAKPPVRPGGGGVIGAARAAA